MAKVAMILLLGAMMAIAATTPVAAKGVEEGPEAVAKWFKTLPGRAPKLTHLEFYFQDIVTGEVPTARLVVKANGTTPAPTGSIVAIDDRLTAGPEVNSTEIGRVQGIYSVADLTEPSLIMSLTFAFTSGRYNGSKLSLLAQNTIFHKYREMPILGGTGQFRLAQGIATAKTFAFNLTSGDATVHYDITLLHY